MSDALTDLEADVRADLARIAHPGAAWLEPKISPDGKPALDVLIVGAGQSGIAIGFGLMRSRVSNILLLDKAAEGTEGPWLTYARMPTLRSPKDYTGPDLDIPSLTYQSWHEARFGKESWQTLGLIPRGHWAEYLLWLRRTIGLPVRNGCELLEIAPAADGLLAAVIKTAGGIETLYARKIVLATGQEGMGGWIIPEPLRHLPSGSIATVADDIDFEKLGGKRIAVIGAGASAFDNAATALEAGAAEVHLLCRRAQIQVIQPYRWLTFRASCAISAISMMPGAGVSCAGFSKCGRGFRKRPMIAARGTPISCSTRARLLRRQDRLGPESNCTYREAPSRRTSSSAAPAST